MFSITKLKMLITKSVGHLIWFKYFLEYYVLNYENPYYLIKLVLSLSYFRDKSRIPFRKNRYIYMRKFILVGNLLDNFIFFHIICFYVKFTMFSYLQTFFIYMTHKKTEVGNDK